MPKFFDQSVANIFAIYSSNGRNTFSCRKPITESAIVLKPSKMCIRDSSYAVVDVKSGAGPFDTVGSLWLYPNGQTMQLYKPANLSRAYITGNYVIQA